MNKNLGKIRKIFSSVFVVMALGFILIATIAFAEVRPGKPTGVSAVAGNGQATISFTPGTTGETPIIDYTVTSSPDNKTKTGASSPITVTGLTNGRSYTFTVKARNSGGTGLASSPSNAVTPSASGGTGGGTGGTGSTGGTLADPDSQTIGVGVAIPGTGIESKGEYKFSVYVRAMYAFSMKVAIALATLMVVYAGYKYLTSRGETGAINEAKDILFSTLMGSALLMLVVLIAHIAGLELNIGSTSVSTSSLPLLTIFS